MHNMAVLISFTYRDSSSCKKKYSWIRRAARGRQNRHLKPKSNEEQLQISQSDWRLTVA